MGRSRRGSAFFSSMWTTLPLSVSSAASTTRSICVTPSTLMPCSSCACRSPCGTQPDTSSALPASRPRCSSVFMADCDGDLTVHVFTTHRSASSRSSTWWGGRGRGLSVETTTTTESTRLQLQRESPSGRVGETSLHRTRLQRARARGGCKVQHKASTGGGAPAGIRTPAAGLPCTRRRCGCASSRTS